jgi:hypothetical protein
MPWVHNGANSPPSRVNFQVREVRRNLISVGDERHRRASENFFSETNNDDPEDTRKEM